MKATPDSKLGYLDAWRGIAILLVIITHSSHFDISGDIGIKVIDSVVWFGHEGVTLFFLLSAFTIFYSLRNNGLSNKNQIIYFFIRRFFRIAPLYYLGIIFYRFFYFKLYTINVGVVENIVFIHWIDPRFYNSSTIMPGGWSITTEFAFYFLVPLFYDYITSINSAVTAVLLSVFISAFLRSILHRIYPHSDWLYFELNPITLMPVFLSGILLYFIIIKKDKYSLKAYHLLLMALIIFIVQVYESILAASYYFAIMFCILIYLTANYSIKLFNSPILKFIGRISFAIYISHFFITWCLRDFHLAYLSGYPVIDLIFRISFTIIFSILISSILHFGIEKPFIVLGKKLITRITHKYSPA